MDLKYDKKSLVVAYGPVRKTNPALTNYNYMLGPETEAPVKLLSQNKTKKYRPMTSTRNLLIEEKFGEKIKVAYMLECTHCTWENPSLPAPSAVSLVLSHGQHNHGACGGAEGLVYPTLFSGCSQEEFEQSYIL